MTAIQKQEKVQAVKGLLKKFFTTQYDAKLRSREQQTTDEADLNAEILAEALVELVVDASRPPSQP